MNQQDEQSLSPSPNGAVAQLVEDEVERKRFLKMVGATGAASFTAFAVAACGGSSKKKTAAMTTTTTSSASADETASFGPGDLGILNYALTLEYLEEKFYSDVVDSHLFSGKTASLLKRFAEEEAEHVRALTAAITRAGGTPAKEPTAHFPLENAGQVAMLAYTVENLGAAAYLGQAPRIKSKDVLAAALSIHSVEGRHAAALGTLVNKPITPDGPFAKPADVPTVLAAVKPFIA